MAWYVSEVIAEAGGISLRYDEALRTTVACGDLVLVGVPPFGLLPNSYSF